MGLMLGSLGERLYVDANAIIYYAEAHPVFGGQVRALFAAVEQGRAVLVTSELTLAETLVVPLRSNNSPLIARYIEIVSPRKYFEIVPVSRSILMESARLRAKVGNRLPDAIHIATALMASCSTFISEDKGIRLPESVKLVRVSDLGSELPQTQP